MAYGSAVVCAIQEIARAGLDLTTLPVTPTATHGNKILNDGKTFLLVKNGSGSPVTVTFNTPGSVDGQAIDDLVVSVAAGKLVAIGPFTSVFNQSDGYVWAVFSAVTDVTIAACRLQNP